MSGKTCKMVYEKCLELFNNRLSHGYKHAE